MRRAAKVDRNQPEIVDALRAMGCSVQSLAAVGDGCPDLLIGAAGKTMLMEIKDGLQPQRKRKLNPLQTEWHLGWRGGPLSLVKDLDGAIRAVKVMRSSDAIEIGHQQALTHLLVGLIRMQAQGAGMLFAPDADRDAWIAALKAVTGHVRAEEEEVA